MTTEAPGLRVRRRSSGKAAYYWVAAAVSRKAKGYKPATVRLHGKTEDQRAARCRTLTAELLEWLGEHRADRAAFDGTVNSLIRCYRTDPDSPYQAVRHSTKHDYDYSLDLLETTIGKRRVDTITRKDVVRWHRGFREPVGDGEPRVRRAHGCMKMLRIVATYGKGMRYEGCRDLRELLSEMEFELPSARDEAMTFDQASAVVKHAIAVRRPMIALAQALQFECSLRQVDVVGFWEPAEPGCGGIVHRGSAWAGGVTWSDISPDLILTKRTTKTAARGEWNLALLPLVMMALQHVPRGVGPIIRYERTRLPYRPNKYQREWRAIARAAGVPDHVQNRDSRAGGITEGDLAGSDPRDLQKLATHSDIKTTARYIRSTTRKATDKVAEQRVASRGNAAGTRV